MKKSFWELLFDKVNFKHILTLIVVVGCFTTLNKLLADNNLRVQIATAYLAVFAAVIYYWIQSNASSDKKTQAIVDMKKNNPPPDVSQPISETTNQLTNTNA